MNARPGWDEYFLGIAEAVAARADCTRRKVGAVIVKDHQLVKPGYNGSPPGMPGCLSDGACPRGRHYELPYNPAARNADETSLVVCACGNVWPCPDAVAPMSSYDTGPGACISVHAEINACVRAGRDRTLGASIYVTREPCDGCYRVVMACGIVRAVWPGGERLLQ